MSYIPEESSDAFYGMVYFPAAAGVNLQKANIYAALNQWYAANGAAAAAKKYKEKTTECIRIDEELTDQYHYGMADGKWEGMMLSKHFCFENWNDEKCHYPETVDCKETAGQKMLVHAECQDNMCITGITKLPEFNNISRRTYTIEMVNGGSEPLSYELSCDKKWLCVSKAVGITEITEEIKVWINWDEITESESGKIIINGAGQTVEVEIRVKIIDKTSLPEGTFVADDGIISMEAEHFAKTASFGSCEWKKIKDYGKTLSSMKVYPTTENFDEIGKAPSLTYRLTAEGDGEYILRGITAPTNNLAGDRSMRYAVSLDGNAPVEADTLTKDFTVGTGHGKRNWSEGVLKNAHYAETALNLTKGLHEITVYPVDAGIVLQKFVLYQGELPESFFGPEESGRILP
jgi:hypothetical protein